MLILLLLLAGFASQGGRATVTYQPTPLEGDGQGCPSDENKAQVIENIHNLIEDNIETESTPEGRLLTDLNTAVEILNQEITDLSNITNGTLAELRQEVAGIQDQVETVTNMQADFEANVLQVINKTGLTRALPAVSCRQIFENRPDLPSGYYWIRSSTGTAVQLYCDMARQCCNGTTGGWTRVAYLDMTDPNQQCPPNWQEITTSGVRYCARMNNAVGSCESVFYPSNGISYSRVCGRVTGYQFCSTDGFDRNNPTIDSNYVDGVSITHGSPRQHVWTFAAGQNEGTHNIGCPCISNPNVANSEVPSFVGDDYFCDTANTPCGTSTNLAIEHPLWDGGGCGPTGGCCENNDPPWFCTTLPQPTTDDIEVRICTDQGLADEEVTVGLIEIYVN